jgi:hypothetical protein
MPTVPSYNSQVAPVQPSELPGAQASPPLHLAQMAQVADAINMRGAAATENTGRDVSAIAADMQATTNEARAKEADAQATMAITQILHGDPDQPGSGYLNSTGKDAVDGAAGVQEQLSKVAQPIMDGMDNDRQRQLVSNAIQQRMTAAQGQIAAHAAQQNKVYELKASELRGNASADAAAKSFDKTQTTGDGPYGGQAYDTNMQATLLELDNQARSVLGQNADQAAIDQYVNTQVAAKVHAPIVKDLVDSKDTQAAKDYLEKNKDYIPDQTYRELGDLVKKGQTNNDALQLSLDLQRSVKGGINAQVKELNDRFEAGQIDAETHDKAEAYLKKDYAMAKAQETDWHRNLLEQVFQFSQQNKLGTFEDLPTSLQQQLQRAGISHQALGIIGRREDPAAARMFGDAMDMAATPDTQAAFLQMDLVTNFLGKVTPQQYMREKLLQNGSKEAYINASKKNLIDSAVASSLSAGLPLFDTKNSNKTVATTAQENLEQFKASAWLAADQAIAANGGVFDKKMVNEAVQNVLLNHPTVNNKHLLWPTTTDSSKSVWQMNKDERAADWTIPDSDRTAITAALTRAGKPVTEATIQGVYKSRFGIKGKPQ